VLQLVMFSVLALLYFGLTKPNDLALLPLHLVNFLQLTRYTISSKTLTRYILYTLNLSTGPKYLKYLSANVISMLVVITSNKISFQVLFDLHEYKINSGKKKFNSCKLSCYMKLFSV